MEMAKVTSKGQITIPISIRRRLGINEGDKILFVNKQEGVLMLNPETVQGDIADYTTETAAAAPPPPVTAPPVSAKTPQPAPVQAPAPAQSDKTAPAPVTETAPKTSEVEFVPAADPPKRKYIPPAPDEPVSKPAAAGGIDLSTLLDDIRSIGDL